jgi:hypothetical protein
MDLQQLTWERVVNKVDLGKGMKARISLSWKLPVSRLKRTENAQRLELFLAELSLLGLDDLAVNDNVDFITILGWTPIDLIDRLRKMTNVGRVQVISVKGRATTEQLEALRLAIPEPEPKPKTIEEVE